MKIILATSDDYWGARAQRVAASNKDVVVAIDRSGSHLRSLRLVLRGSIPISAAVKMLMSQRQLPQTRPYSETKFANNADLRTLAEHESADLIILFRAGLIISGKTIATCDVQNIHCARLDGYGGLAAIHRALRDRASDQFATLHRVTREIDSGEILDTEQFQLDLHAGYAANEAVAYEAGLRLLERTLNRLSRG